MCNPYIDLLHSMIYGVYSVLYMYEHHIDVRPSASWV